MNRRKFLIQTASGITAASAAALSAADGAAIDSDEANDQPGAATAILIKDGVIVPMDGANRTLENQAVLIHGNRITAIDDAEKLKEEYSIDKVIDASGMAILPGFVNGHTHTADTALFRGIAEDMTPDEYGELAIPLEVEILTEEDINCFARLGSIELLKSGNTCANELGLGPQEPTALAFEEAGVRGVLAPDVSDIAESGDGQPDAALKKARFEEARRLLNKWHRNENSILTVRVANYMPILCTPETLLESKALANEYGTGLNAHAGFGEGAQFHEKYGKSQMEYLADIGYLDENTALVHMLTTEEVEIAPLRETGTWIIHCPFEMAKRGLSAPMDMMYKANLNIALGSDWLMFDPFEQMRFAAVLARLDSGDMGVRKAYDFLEMATIKAAEAVGLGDQIGSLEVGKKADVILVDFDQAHISPMNRHYDLVTKLVYNAHGSDVRTVIVDGKIVVENGEIQTIDEGKIIAEANRRSDDALTKRFSM